MFWGIGTGRCGTRSLAEYLGGLHEPKPWFKELPAKYAAEEITSEEMQELDDHIHERASMDTPIIVDLKHSMIVPLIMRADPEARFIWPVREPFATIHSLLCGGAWTDQDWNGSRKLHPKGGWKDEGRVDKAIWYYEHTYKNILGHAYKDAIILTVRTEDIPVHVNEYPKDKRYYFSKEEAKKIVEKCWGLYLTAAAPATDPRLLKEVIDASGREDTSKG